MLQRLDKIISNSGILSRKDADKIIVLEEGKIADIGTHEELINRPGFYSNVWNIQQMIEDVQE